MKLLEKPPIIWLEILSELLINLTASLFIIVFIEPIFIPIKTIEDMLVLTSKFALGILFLILSKKMREDSRK